MYVDEDGNIKVEKGDKLTQEEADKINETSDKSVDELLQEIDEEVKKPEYEKEAKEVMKAKPEDRWKIIKKYHPDMEEM